MQWAIAEGKSLEAVAIPAVKRGENARTVAEACGITLNRYMEMEAACSNAAQKAAKSGEHIQVVAARHGISDLDCIAVLEDTAARSSLVLKFVGDGKNVDWIAKRLGIAGSAAIAQLENAVLSACAIPRLQTEKNVKALVKLYGFTMPETIATLEWAAIDKFAVAEVNSGQSVQYVLNKYGITDADNIDKLRRLVDPEAVTAAASEFAPRYE